MRTHRASAVVLVLIAVATPRSFSAGAPGATWPTQQREAVTRQCRSTVAASPKKGNADKACACVLDVLQQKYTSEQFQDAKNDSPSPFTGGNEAEIDEQAALQYCVATTRDVDRQRRWPASARSDVIATCEGARKSAKVCHCAFNRLQERFTAAVWPSEDSSRRAYQEAVNGTELLVFMIALCEGGLKL